MDPRQKGKIKFSKGVNPSKKLRLIGGKISLTVFFVLVFFCIQAYSFDITPYSGPLFNTMSQIGETVDSKAAIIRVRKSEVTRLALFARSKKQLHQNEKMEKIQTIGGVS